MNDIIFAGKHFLTYNVSRHQHKSWELIYCTDKCGTFIFDHMTIPYGVGDIVVIPNDTPHENRSLNGFMNYHLNIDNATLPFHEPVLIRDDGNESILHLFSDAYYLFHSENEGKLGLLSAYGELIVRHMAAGWATHPQNRATDTISRSIVENYADASYEVDQVLKEMPYSYDYLCRMFKQDMGMTPHRYLTNQRLRAAADMLCTGSHTNISEVALLCGFRDPLYFSRLFKKKFAVSPSTYYRQKLLEHQNQDLDSDSQKIILPD